VNSSEQAREYLASVYNPLSFVHDVIGSRTVDDRDECVSFLLEQLVRLAYKYDPKRDKRGPDFNGFANYRLRRFGVADYYRHTAGRGSGKFSTHTYQRDVPVVFSLDTDTDGGRLVTTVAAGGSDPAASSDPAFARLVAQRDRRRAGDLETLGIKPAA
jgi:hypothetical protein